MTRRLILWSSIAKRELEWNSKVTRSLMDGVCHSKLTQTWLMGIENGMCKGCYVQGEGQ